MNTKEIMDLINKARFLMFTLEQNPHFPAGNLPQYREMIDIYVNSEIHNLIAGTSTTFDLIFLKELVKELASVYDNLPKIEENDTARLNELAVRVSQLSLFVGDMLDDQDQLNNLSDTVIEELNIYHNLLAGRLNIIFMNLEFPCLSSRYSTMFLENRLDGLESWFYALENHRLPDMTLVQIPMRNIEDREVVEDNEEVEATKEVVEDNSPGLIASIVNCFIRGFNNLFIHQNAAVLPNNEYVVTHTGGALDPAMTVTELDQPVVNNLAGVIEHCG